MQSIAQHISNSLNEYGYTFDEIEVEEDPSRHTKIIRATKYVGTDGYTFSQPYTEEAKIEFGDEKLIAILARELALRMDEQLTTRVNSLGREVDVSMHSDARCKCNRCGTYVSMSDFGGEGVQLMPESMTEGSRKLLSLTLIGELNQQCECTETFK